MAGWFMRVLALALVVVFVAACGPVGGPDRPDDQVGDRAVASVDVLPGEGLAFTNVGQQAALTVVVANEAGEVLEGVAVTWSTTGGVVAVDANGVVSAAAVGSGTVSAEAGGVSATIDVVVSLPVARGVRVDVPVLIGRDLEIVSDYGSETARVTRAGGVRVAGDAADANVLVSPTRHSLVRVLDDEGRLFLGVSSLGEGVARAGVEPLVVDHRSTARALLLTHPFLLTTDPAMASLIETVLADHPAVDALAGVVAAFGGVHASVMREPAMGRVLQESALAVVEALVDALGGVASDDDGSWEAQGAASTTSSGVGVPLDVSNASFSLTWSGDRLSPQLSTDGMGMGVGYRFRHLPIDASSFDSVFDVRDAALAFSGGRTYAGRSSFDFLTARPRPSTAYVGPTTWFKNLMITHWLARGAKELFGIEGPRLGTSPDQVYLVVGVTPGFGLFDRAQTRNDQAWMRSLPGVESDMRQVRALNLVTLALAGINGLVDLSGVELDASVQIMGKAVTCATSVMPDVMTDGFDFGQLGVDLTGCAIAALLDAGFDDAAEVAGIAQETSRQLFELVVEIARSVGSSDAGLVQRQAEPVSAAVLLTLVKAGMKVGSVGSSVHQLFDTVRLTPMQVAVFVRGTPKLRGPAPERRPPQAQLFVRPSNQVVVGERITLDARGSVDVDGGGIVEYRFSASGGTTTRTDGVLPLTYHVSGTHEVCVRVVNRAGEVSDRACQVVRVLEPERQVEQLPDLVVYDYALYGFRLGDSNFITYLIDHDEELPLTVMVRNAGSVSTPQGSRASVAVFLDGRRIASHTYRGGADANYGGADLEYRLNTSRNPIAPGEHTVTIWVDADDEIRERNVANNTRSFHLTVLPPNNLPPSADFTFSVDGLRAAFTDRSTDPDGSRDLHRWSWAFGDGGTSTERSPVHTYRAAGAYDVTLEVRDRGGLSHRRTRRVVVDDPNRPPVAAFSFGVDGLTVAFTNTSTDPDGAHDLAAWLWDLGDGSVSTDRDPVHTFASPGTYAVTLTAFDVAGASDSVTWDVTVVAPAGASVNLQPAQVTLPVGGTQSFTASVSGVSDTRVTWSVSCGSLSGSGSTRTYTAPGTPAACTVSATSVADAGAWAEATVTVVNGDDDDEPRPAVLLDDFDDGDYTTDPAWTLVVAGNKDQDPALNYVDVTSGYARFVSSNHGGRGGSVGLEIAVDIPVDDETTLQFDALATFRDVGAGCGWTCREYPANVSLHLEDAAGNEYRLTYAVNYGDELQNQSGPDWRLITTPVTQGAWERDLRFVVRAGWAPAVRVTMVGIFGSGWNFDGGIDNVALPADTSAPVGGLRDDFASYTVGTFPNPPWVGNANAVSNPQHNRVVADPVDSGNAVLQLYGTHPGNWSALAYHPCAFPDTFGATFRTYVHGYYIDSVGRGAVAQMRQGTSWTNPGRTLLFFSEHGEVRMGTTTVGSFQHDRWHDVRVQYARSGTQLTLTAWLDGVLLGSTTLTIDDAAREASLDHFGFDVRGAVLFDDVRVDCLP